MNIKKAMSFLLIGGILFGNGAVFAQTPVQTTPVYIEDPVFVVDDFSKGLTVSVEGEMINLRAYYSENQTPMIPLREAVKKLGYEISFDNSTRTITLTKGTDIIKFGLDSDGYSKNNSSAEVLNQKPQIKEGNSYVPLALFEKFMNVDAKFGNGAIFMATKEDGTDEKVKEEAIIEGKIVEIGDKRITVTDDLGKNTIILNVTDETKIVDPMVDERLKIAGPAFETLKVGDRVRGHHSMVMTKSLPPISNASKIEIINGMTVSKAKVDKVDLENKTILSGGQTGILFRLSNDAKIVDAKGMPLKLEDVKEGSEIEVYHSMAMAMSLPGQTTAYKVVIK